MNYLTFARSRISQDAEHPGERHEKRRGGGGGGGMLVAKGLLEHMDGHPTLLQECNNTLHHQTAHRQTNVLRIVRYLHTSDSCTKRPLQIGLQIP